METIKDMWNLAMKNKKISITAAIVVIILILAIF